CRARPGTPREDVTRVGGFRRATRSRRHGNPYASPAVVPEPAGIVLGVRALRRSPRRGHSAREPGTGEEGDVVRRPAVECQVGQHFADDAGGLEAMAGETAGK